MALAMGKKKDAMVMGLDDENENKPKRKPPPNIG
jgi:hypothetical protein